MQPTPSLDDAAINAVILVLRGEGCNTWSHLYTAVWRVRQFKTERANAVHARIKKALLNEDPLTLNLNVPSFYMAVRNLEIITAPIRSIGPDLVVTFLNSAHACVAKRLRVTRVFCDVVLRGMIRPTSVLHAFNCCGLETSVGLRQLLGDFIGVMRGPLWQNVLELRRTLPRCYGAHYQRMSRTHSTICVGGNI